MRRLCALVVVIALSGCATDQNIWHDFTNAHRSDAQLGMDYGTCQMYSDSVPATVTPGYCPRCAALDAMTTIINRSNAFNSCMQSHGWQHVG